MPKKALRLASVVLVDTQEVGLALAAKASHAWGLEGIRGLLEGFYRGPSRTFTACCL